MLFSRDYSMVNGIIDGGVLDLPPLKNYGKVFLDTLKQHGDRICLIDGITAEKISSKEFIEIVLNVAASLSRMGIKKGEVVALCSENRIEFMITVFAVIYIGGVINFINCAYSKDELIHTLNISKPKYMFFSPATYNKYYDTVSKLRLIRKHLFIFGNATGNAFGFDALVLTDTSKRYLQPANTVGSDRAIILYSSGTTGLPKGAIWTHQSLILSIFQPISSKRNPNFLGVAPWTNTIGFMLSMQAMSRGMTMVFLAKFTEESYLQTIEKYQVNFLLAVPPLVILLSKSQILDNYDISTVKSIQSGGSVLEVNTIKEVKNRIPSLENVFQAYGMTEATGLITLEKDDQIKEGSVGKVVPGIIAKVVDVKSRKTLGPKEVGEICIKGLALFGGYIGNAGGDDYDVDGFFKTGDIAYYDEDGYFYIVDRLKELIKYKTWQVPPSEVEAVILQHPAVKDVGVVGMPDRLAGELPVAFVVKLPGVHITEKEIIDFVASKVSPWKRLRGGVRFVSEIPKNGSGKILRKELRKLLQKTKSKI